MPNQVQIYLFLVILLCIVFALDWYLKYRIKRTMEEWKTDIANRRHHEPFAAVRHRFHGSTMTLGAGSIPEFISRNPWFSIGMAAFFAYTIAVLVTVVKMVQCEQIAHQKSEKAKYYGVCRERRLAASCGTLAWLDQ